ncbi:MAG: phosphoribosylanthranilate isomerase [Planctomyces sp.]
MWIKFCGATRPEDAVAVVQAGADALGLNFFPGSKRYVAPEHARGLAEAARAAGNSSQEAVGSPQRAQGCLIVGVFVNAEPAHIRDTVHCVGLDAVQLHGDETVEEVREIRRLLPQTLLIRALRASGDRLPELLAEIEQLQSSGAVDALLLDAFVPGHFGGTGARLESAVFTACQQQTSLPLILAGGLDPENVAAAVRIFQPFGVDAAGGVENQPGHKNAGKMRVFVDAAWTGCTGTPVRQVLRRTPPPRL